MELKRRLECSIATSANQRFLIGDDCTVLNKAWAPEAPRVPERDSARYLEEE